MRSRWSLGIHRFDGILQRGLVALGLAPMLAIHLEMYGDKFPKKMVTHCQCQGILITVWYGTYKLSGEHKYLDFLYQTGLEVQNVQGFGILRYSKKPKSRSISKRKIPILRNGVKSRKTTI